MTTIENVKVAFIREKSYNNLRDWIADENNVYIGRGGVVFIDKVRYPPFSSPFCNIYHIGKDGTRDEVLEKYEKYIRYSINSDSNFKANFLLLKGKHLGCWCKPEISV